MPRRIQSMGNLCLGGKTRRKNYREEKIWGKDGAKPSLYVKVFKNLKVLKFFRVHIYTLAKNVWGGWHAYDVKCLFSRGQE